MIFFSCLLFFLFQTKIAQKRAGSTKFNLWRAYIPSKNIPDTETKQTPSQDMMPNLTVGFIEQQVLGLKNIRIPTAFKRMQTFHRKKTHLYRGMKKLKL